MKIVMNVALHVPNLRLLETGREYDVPASLGKRLVANGQAHEPTKAKAPKRKEGDA